MAKPQQTATQQVAATVAAGTPVFYVVTWEEERLEQMLEYASNVLFADDRLVWQWTEASGFTTGPGKDQDLRDPLEALAFIIKSGAEAIFLMKDLPSQFESSPALIRAVRDVYDHFSSQRGSVVLSHPRSLIPPDLNKELYLLELPLPDSAELLLLLSSLNDAYEGEQKASAEWLDRVSFAMRGLTLNEVRDLYAQLMSEAVLEIEPVLARVNHAKAQL